MTQTNKKLKLTLVRSKYHRLKKHQQTLQCLGLRRMHQTIEVQDIPSVRGMINQVSYMLDVVPVITNPSVSEGEAI